MKLQTIILSFLSIVLLSQCKKTIEPLGYYYVLNDYFQPVYVFHYDDSIHYGFGFPADKISEAKAFFNRNESFQRNNNFFYDNEFSIVELQLTIDCQIVQYHFVFKPSTCKFYIYHPERLVGTYEFIPSRSERGLISFATSLLDFGDSLPEFNSFNNLPDSVIVEDAYISLLIKSDRLNIDLTANLNADEVSDALFFLCDAVDALVHDYCKPKYRTAENPSDIAWNLFYQKILDKYYSHSFSTDVH